MLRLILTLDFSDYKGKYVVLFFYPLDFTFVCPTEIIAFSEAASTFAKSNCQVIAASTGKFQKPVAYMISYILPVNKKAKIIFMIF